VGYKGQSDISAAADDKTTSEEVSDVDQDKPRVDVVIASAKSTTAKVFVTN
jgi:hypothetical protein